MPGCKWGNELSWLRSCSCASLVALVTVFAFSVQPVWAANAQLPTLPQDGNATFQVVLFAVFSGAVSFALMAATWLIRERRLTAEKYISISTSFADLKAKFERTDALVDAPDQRLVIWSGPEEKPIVRGVLPEHTGAPQQRSNFVAFGTWMKPASAHIFDHAVDELRQNANGFNLVVETQAGSILEVQGRISGSQAFVRFISLQAERAALAELQSHHSHLQSSFNTLQNMLEQLPMPVWQRDRSGRLCWINSAYQRSVDANERNAVIDAGLELLDTGERQIAAKIIEQGNSFSQRIPVTISGDRCMMEVTEVGTEGETAGMAVDLSEIDALQSSLQRIKEGHAQTLDNLVTAVAIFDSTGHLQFHNSAFQDLWELTPEFLQSQPENRALLDALRADQKLAEQPDWRKWKDRLLNVHTSMEPEEQWWHLPDSRTLRVVINPHTDGGATWVFEDVSEKLALESRYNEMLRVQGETLDHLAEGVAVFGSDGRLKLFNPALTRLWRLADNDIDVGTHISELVRLCTPLTLEPDIWEDLLTSVTGIEEQRQPLEGRMAQTGNHYVDFALVPLPNGQSMLTFVDVSDSVEIESVLTDRNEALETADELKSLFVQHVSYELRAPLTNIVGFSELLGSSEIGSLNSKQSAYLDHITTSSSSLMAIVNNILDLATVDAGIIELDLNEIDIKASVNSAVEGVRDRLSERAINLTISVDEDAGSFVADESRIRQILFNLLSNAVNFTPDGGKVGLMVENLNDRIAFRITDTGPGIPKADQATMFERFESRSKGHARGGTGLGLSIVKSFVMLHGGTIELDEKVKNGTSLICTFPKQPVPTSQAAE